MPRLSLVGLRFFVLLACGGGPVDPTPTPTLAPSPTATPTATPTPTPEPSSLTQLCGHASSLLQAILADEDAVKVLEAFLEVEPENLVPLLTRGQTEFG